MQQAIDTKPFFQRLLRPATRVLAALGVTPNQVTLTTIVLSLAAGAVIMVYPEKDWPILLVPVVLTLRVAFNHIDGLLATEFCEAFHTEQELAPGHRLADRILDDPGVLDLGWSDRFLVP